MSTSPQFGRSGRIVTVFAAKGGCGKTTLAINLAAVLSRGGSKRVCLVDLDLTFGDVACSLRLQSPRSLANLTIPERPVDMVGIRSAVTPFSPGLDTILAPAKPGEGEQLPSKVVSELLVELPRWYDYVVIDAPARFTPHALSALDSSHHHVLLTTPERPALKNLRLTLDMLDLLAYDAAARSVVFNRCDSGVGLSATEIERVVKAPIAGRIPYSRDVPASTNLGEPLASAQPDHPVSQAIREFAATHLLAAKPTGRRWDRDPTT